MAGAPFAGILYRRRHRDPEEDGPAHDRPGWGSTMVLTEPDAGSDVGAGRTKAVAAARRLVAHRGRQAVHHLGRAGPHREHRAPGAGPPRGRRRRAPRACRCSSCRSSTSTPRPASSASATASSSPTSSTRWACKASTTCELRFGEDADHPAMGWLVGDVHDGIAQMFQVIEHARMMVGTKAIATLSTGYLNALEYAKTRVQSADLTQAGRQDRAAGDDHPPPGRAPQPDAEQGLRRGPARAGALHRLGAGPDRDRPRTTAPTPRWTRPSTTCCCRSSRAPAPSGPTTSSPRRCRPSAAPATCRTTRSSSTSATPRSTRSTRAPPRSRARTSSSARSSGTAARR